MWTLVYFWHWTITEEARETLREARFPLPMLKFLKKHFAEHQYECIMEKIPCFINWSGVLRNIWQRRGSKEEESFVTPYWAREEEIWTQPLEARARSWWEQKAQSWEHTLEAHGELFPSPSAFQAERMVWAVSQIRQQRQHSGITQI